MVVNDWGKSTLTTFGSSENAPSLKVVIPSHTTMCLTKGSFSLPKPHKPNSPVPETVSVPVEAEKVHPAVSLQRPEIVSFAGITSSRVAPQMVQVYRRTPVLVRVGSFVTTPAFQLWEQDSGFGDSRFSIVILPLSAFSQKVLSTPRLYALIRYHVEPSLHFTP